MKTSNHQSSVSNLKNIWLSLVGLCVAILCLSLPGLYTRSAQADDEHEGKSAPPLVALLSPHDRAALNASSLHVQALVAAFKPQRNNTFVFNGQTITGRNSGQVSRVDLALDGVVVQSIDTRRMGRQMVADFEVDLSKVADGLHIVTVTAFQGEDHVPAVQSTTFTLDRTLVAAQVNRIERAATPQPFAAFSVRADGDDRDDRDDDWRRPTRLDLLGTFVPGNLSDGIDLAKDRVVVALGSHLTVLEAGKLRCQGRGEERTCRYEDRSQQLLQFIELRQGEGKQWNFTLRGRALPSDAHTLSLRVGNDWGGIDLATGERLVSLRPSLDTSRQMQSLIGKDGGTVETLDQSGVLIRLEIPAGALTQDTLIKVTPLLASPLPGSPQTLQPGVEFEPEGLRFAQPAKLTLDFSNTGQTVGSKDSIYLLTSPLTTLPLFGSVDTAHRKLTALLRHFSQDAAGPPNGALADLVRWANSVLTSNQNLTQAEMESLLAVAAEQQKLGCTTDCIDVGQVTQKIEASVRAIVVAECPGNTANPTLAALKKYLQLEALVQQVGGSVPEIRQCEHGILAALINKAGTEPAPIPDDLSGYCISCDPTITQLFDLSKQAQALGFNDLQTQALQKLDEAMRKLAVNVVAKVKGREGMPDEAAVRQAGVADLQSEQALVAGDDAAVLSVDPGLPAFIQQEIDSLTNQGTMQIIVTQATAIYQFGDNANVEPHDWRSVSLFGSCQSPDGEGTFACTGAAPLPVTLSTGSMMQTSLTQPAPNRFVWDVTAVDPPPLPPASSPAWNETRYIGQIQIKTSGTLRLEASQGTPFVEISSCSNSRGAPDGGNGCQFCVSTDGSTSSCPFSGPATLYFFFMWSGERAGFPDIGPRATLSGTFTPQ